MAKTLTGLGPRARTTTAGGGPAALARLALGARPEATGEAHGHLAISSLLDELDAEIETAVLELRRGARFVQPDRERIRQAARERLAKARKALLAKAAALVETKGNDLADRRASKLSGAASDPAAFSAALAELEATVGLKDFNAGALAERLEGELRRFVAARKPGRIEAFTPAGRAALTLGAKMLRDSRTTPEARVRFKTLAASAEDAVVNLDGLADQVDFLVKAAPILRLTLAGVGVDSEIMAAAEQRAALEARGGAA